MIPATQQRQPKYHRKWNQTFIQMAQLLSQRSRCTKHQVACILTNDRRPIITGINGTPPGYLNCDQKFYNIPTNTKSKEYELYADEHHLWSNHNEQHAEQNAVAFAAKLGITTLNTVVYLTMTQDSISSNQMESNASKIYTSQMINSLVSTNNFLFSFAYSTIGGWHCSVL